MIKVIGNDMKMLNRQGVVVQTFTRIGGIPPDALYDGTGMKVESNMSIHNVEAAIVEISKELAMKEARL